MSDKTTIIAIGAYPPPVHGFSEITRQMTQAIADEPRTNVLKISRTPVFFKNERYIILDVLKAAWKLCQQALVRGSASTYVGLSGGAGLYIDLMHIILAKVTGQVIWLHHHNYTYITRLHLAIRLINSVASDANHIFLCNCMSQDYKRLYKSNHLKSITLSNISFRPSVEMFSNIDEGPRKEFTVGFLSNITTDKGIFLYFDIMRALRSRHPNIRGAIAGPVDRKIQRIFNEFIAAGQDYLTYVGPVYGGAKEDFFDSIDMLLFPSIYANEAEPVTIAEALSHSLPVVATNRGCIGEMDNSAGIVIVPTTNNQSEFETFAVNSISKLASDEEYLAKQKALVAERFASIQFIAKINLKHIAAAIADGRGLPLA